jgi:hypothetical protein
MGRQDLLEHMHTKHQLCGICTLDWWTGDIWLVERYAAWKLVVSSFFFCENTYVFHGFFSIFPHFTIFAEVMIRMMWDDYSCGPQGRQKSHGPCCSDCVLLLVSTPGIPTDGLLASYTSRTSCII